MSHWNSQRPKSRQQDSNAARSSHPASSAPGQNVAQQDSMYYNTGPAESNIPSQASFNFTTQIYMQYYQQLQLQLQQQQQLQAAYMQFHMQPDSEWDMPQEPSYQDTQQQLQGQTFPVQNAPYMNSMPMFTPQFQPLPHMNPFHQSPAQPARHFSSSAEPYTLPASTYVPPEGHRTSVRRREKPPSPRQVTPPVAPVPTNEYQEQTSIEPAPITSPNSLLVILDLNGTLIHRRRRGFPPSFAKRPGLDAFFEYLFANFKVMVWTSSQPKTVEEVLDRLLKPEHRKKLVSVWARDTLDLTREQYREKVQVYKRLDKVWDSKAIQAAYPRRRKDRNVKGASKRWDQTNTILIDDSALKAVSQPHNIIEIPEFTNDPEVDEEKNLQTVMRQLKILSYQADVSRKLRQWADRRHEGATTVNPDAVDNFWATELEAEEAALATRMRGLDQDEEEDGGVRFSVAHEPGDRGELQAGVVDAQRLISEELRITNESEDNKDIQDKGLKMSKSQKRAVRRRRAEAAMKGKKKQ